MPLVAGVDSSTQSTKAEIRDADTGALLGSGTAPHPRVTPPVAEQDPAAWWDAFEAAIGAALDDAEVAGVDAIAVAGQQHGMVCLDAAGEVIRPAKLWCDTTSRDDAAWLLSRHAGGAAGWAQACGTVPVAALTITKLSWLHRSEPGNWGRLGSVALPHDWLTSRLTHRLTTDRGDASGTGYWSPAEDRYRFDLLAIVDASLDWPSMVPEVLGPLDVAGEWTSRHDGAGSTIVAPGTGDNMAAAVGIGLVEGDIAVSIGTSGTVYGVSSQPVADPTGAVAGFADATGRFLPLVCTLNATKVTEAARRWCGFASHLELDLAALSAGPGAGGVTLLPYLDGERTPNLPGASGNITGLRSDTTPAHLARAAFEGVVCGLLDGLDALQRQVSFDGALHLVGGGARSPAYRQVLADLAQRPVSVPSLEQAVAVGACVQAAAVLHRRHLDDVRAAWAATGALGTTVEAEPSVDAATAGGIRDRYRRLRELVTGALASQGKEP